MAPTTARIVLYRLTADDAERANRRRVARPQDPSWVPGAQAHVGNSAREGDVVPLLVVRVWLDEFGPGAHGVNGQAFLDGNDVLWVTSAPESPEDKAHAPGHWRWPVRG